MYYYLYKLLDSHNGKFYYGVHQTSNIEDGYMGSGVRLNTTIRSRCTKEIIEWFDNENDMYAKEKEVITEELVADPQCYNMKVGGAGGDTISNHPNKQDIINRIRTTLTTKPTEELNRLSLLKRRPGKLNGMYGVNRSGNNAPMFGKHHTPETIEAIRTKAKKRVQDPDYVNPNYGNKLSKVRIEAIRKQNSRTYVFIKDDQRIYVTNLAAFCRKYLLNECAMRHVLKGRQTQHKGYYNA